MNKDVIYIDVEDDVTTIIGKIKASKEKIVALVPPKRPGALQSAVNLRLLDRMATSENKKLVLITSNPALVALSANAQIPVARNLQSKPEVADIPALAVDNSDDIIDGADLPVGEHAAKVPVVDGTRDQMRSDVIETLDIDKDSAPVALAGAAKATKAAKSKNKSKIPNFDTFRKKLIIGISAGVLLIALLVWMFFIAPAATIVIAARTSPAPVSTAVTLTTTGSTNIEEDILQSVMQQEKKDETIEFDATGQRDIGEKATGTVRFSTSDAETAINGVTIPTGTALSTSGGLVFTTNESVTISTSNFRNAPVGITAAESGTRFNGASGSLSGAPSRVSATITNSPSGGTSKVVKVVSAADVERAQGELIGRSTDEMKKTLSDQFKGNEKVISDSFTVDRAPAVSAPAVNQEAADGKATLTIATTYTIYAIEQDELAKYLKQILDDQRVGGNQKIYDDGSKNAQFSNFRKDDDTLSASLIATGQIGPRIDEADIKEQVKGKRYGDVQATLEAIEGIREVDVKFSWPWVTSVPNNDDKIKIEFKLENE